MISSKVWRAVSWAAHRSLCLIGIHAPDRKWELPYTAKMHASSISFGGWFCPICGSYRKETHEQTSPKTRPQETSANHRLSGTTLQPSC